MGLIARYLIPNLEIAAAQGFVSPADEAILREQLSRLNVSAFGGDQDLYMSSKTAIKNTIDHYAEIYYNKVASGEIDANLPPNYNKETGTEIPRGLPSRQLIYLKTWGHSWSGHGSLFPY